MCILNRNMKLIPESVRVQGKHSKYIRYNELELGVLELLLLVSVDDGDDSEDDAENG